MIGLARSTAAAAALLLNLEGVFTALLAWFAFRSLAPFFGGSGGPGGSGRSRSPGPSRQRRPFRDGAGQPARRSRSIRASMGGWVTNSRISPRRVAPEMPKAAIWSGSGSRP